jgi:hypothetical protein
VGILVHLAAGIGWADRSRLKAACGARLLHSQIRASTVICTNVAILAPQELKYSLECVIKLSSHQLLRNKESL